MTDETTRSTTRRRSPTRSELGYAEADPSGDVEGLDAVNKLVILARLAFDRWLDPAAIATRPDGPDGPAGPGITDGLARRPARRRALPAGSSGSLASRIARRRRRARRHGPADRACRSTRQLGRTSGVRNRIEVDAVPVGRGRVRRSGRGRCRDVVGRPRRPARRGRRGVRIDVGPASGGRHALGRPRWHAPDRPRSWWPRAGSGIRSMTDVAHGSAAAPTHAHGALPGVPARSPTRHRA